MRKIAEARIEDAEKLYDSERYDGSIYLCGYAIEMALKARICKTLQLDGFPSTRSEFREYPKLKTHDLDILLNISGMEEKVKTTEFLADWSVVCTWDPQIRYNPIGSSTCEDTKFMIESSKKLLSVL